jgi:hypothetical protein
MKKNTAQAPGWSLSFYLRFPVAFYPVQTPQISLSVPYTTLIIDQP